MKPIEDYVVSIPDFPEPGIIFRDVTSVLQDAEGLHLAIDLMQEKLEGLDFDVVVGPESRGFIFGVPIAYNLKKPLIHLIEGLGGKVVKTVFLMELAGLHGRDRLQGYDIDSVIVYPGK